MSLKALAATLGLMAVVCGWASAAAQETPPARPGPTPESSDVPEPSPRLNGLARFCAGLEVESSSELFDLTQTDDWKRYAADENDRWAAFQDSAKKIKSWVEAEISPHKTLNPNEFYPFGGPDILFATLMRPSAGLYVLVGLEPVGSIPDLDIVRRTPLAEYLNQFSVALDDIIRLSFFRRADLAVEMKTPVIDGVLPVVMVLLARTDKEILSVERGRLNAHGEFVDAANDTSRKPRALRLRFRDRGRREPKTLLYLSQDLSNPAIDSNQGFRSFIEKNLSRSFGFVKSASYLMHKPVFSSIAGLILKVSDVILQDDSGMPYRLFDKAVWEVSLYGGYKGPIDLFKDFYEPDLADAFAAGAKPLGFRLGYGKRATVLLAVRRSS